MRVASASRGSSSGGLGDGAKRAPLAAAAPALGRGRGGGRSCSSSPPCGLVLWPFGGAQKASRLGGQRSSCSSLSPAAVGTVGGDATCPPPSPGPGGGRPPRGRANKAAFLPAGRGVPQLALARPGTSAFPAAALTSVPIVPHAWRPLRTRRLHVSLRFFFFFFV